MIVPTVFAPSTRKGFGDLVQSKYEDLLNEVKERMNGMERTLHSKNCNVPEKLCMLVQSLILCRFYTQQISGIKGFANTHLL